MKLRISDDLSLPADAITQTFGILAVRGAGKSNLAAAMAEEMAAAGLPFVVVDPVGCWYGLRSSGDGKAPGIAIPIFGGRHGDVPLERTGGNMIADLVVSKRLSCVLDVSDFSEGDKKAFLLDFARRLYQTNSEPLHLFLEEADDYAPQRPMRDEAQLLRAWENIVRRGRARGLGITMITQRSAALNKNLLTQIETLCVLRTTSPQDRKAIAGWVEYHGQAEELLGSLPSLESGEAWIWSPSWLGAMKRIHVRRRWTYDSGATPKTARATRPPATLADVDLDAVRSAMSDTIARAKENDPRELRKQISELKRQAKLPAAPTEHDVSRLKAEAMKEARAEWSSRVQAFEQKLRAVQQQLGRIGKLFAKAFPIHEEIAGELLKLDAVPVGVGPAAAPVPPPVRRVERAQTREPRSFSRPRSDRHGSLPVGERKVLTAVAQYDDGATREQLTVLTGYKRSSRDAYIQRLRERGFLETAGDRVMATETGTAILGDDFEPLPTGPALREHWLPRLPEGERRVLEVLIGRFPYPVDRAELDEPIGYKRSSRDAYLQRLLAKRLITSERGSVRASELLFEGGSTSTR